MQKTFSDIIKNGGIQKVNEEIVSVEEIFRLQRMDRVKAHERAYLR
jgi:phosphoenolpyruvate phosphomutase